MRRLVALLLSLGVCIALAMAFITPVADSAVARPPTVSAKASHSSIAANGGAVALRITVHGAATCTFFSTPVVVGFAGKVKCSNGSMARSGRLGKNSGRARMVHLMVRVANSAGSVTAQGTMRQSANVTTTTPLPAAAPPPTTTPPPMTTPPPTTTPPPPPPPTSFCVGTSASCFAIFAAADYNDATALQVGYVDLGVACPDPGVCETPVGDQLDAIVVGMNTGSSGMSDPGLEVDNFALVLPGGGQATLDDITFDSSVPYAMGGLGPEGPNTSFAATIYFDAPSGTSWSQVNFRYTSYNFESETVYTFTS